MIFLAISIIPISFLGIATYSNSRSAAIERFNDKNISQLDAIKLKFLFEIDEIYYTGIHFSLDRDVVRFFSCSDHESALYRELLNAVQKKLYSYRLVNGIDSIYIIGSDNSHYAFDNPSLLDGYKSFSEEFSDFLAEPDNFVWGNPKRSGTGYLVPMYRKLYDDNGEVKGILIINVKEEKIADRYVQYQQNSERYAIINKKDIIISSNDKDIIGFALSDIIHPENRAKMNGYSFETDITDIKSFVNSCYEVKNKLVVACFTPVSVVDKSIIYILSTTALLCLISLIVCFVASYLVSRNLGRPIIKIINRLEEKRLNTADSTSQEGSLAATRMLKSDYPGLIGLLEKTIDDVYEAQEGRRLAEIKALEYQINPHFLYNTLSSVIWLCDEGDIANAIKITKALSKLFKISISDNELIPLNTELDYISNYLEIQSIRYPEKFDVVIQCDTETRSYIVPKLILQPLVENSIYHGIKELRSMGEICIFSYNDGEDLIIEVRDNAGGMDKAKIEQLNEFLSNRQQSSDNSYGIGVANVNNRIKLYYGEKYGLHYEQDENLIRAILRLKAKRS